MSQIPHFRKPFQSQHAIVFETLPKYAWQHFYYIFQLLWQRLTWKMSLLKIFEILGLFVNTLTPNDKY